MPKGMYCVMAAQNEAQAKEAAFQQEVQTAKMIPIGGHAGLRLKMWHEFRHPPAFWYTKGRPIADLSPKQRKRRLQRIARRIERANRK